jgi:hypothetical protein
VAAYRYRLPRKYRYRPRRRYGTSGSRGPLIAVAAVAVLAAGSGAKAAHHGTGGGHHGGPAAVTDVVVPAGSDLSTPAGWASALLAADSLPQTSCNLSAVREWEAREGGGFGNQAAFNPLNVNPGPGAGWPGYNATGAWAFPDSGDGLKYTVQTLNNGYYPGILSALRAGNSAQAVCSAIEASPWAASHYGYDMTANC